MQKANVVKSEPAACQEDDWPGATPPREQPLNALAAPLVSIVTPVRNGARYLAELLDSVRAQDYPRLEHVVVDGNSGDGTLEVLRAANDVVWASRPDASMYAALNEGIRMARGTVLGCLNADDRSVPGAIDAVVRYLMEHPDVDAVYGDYVYIDEAGRRMPRRPPVAREFSVEVLKRYNFVPAHSTFVRKRIVEDRSLWFDAGLQFAGDWEWMLRLGRAGVRFAHLSRVLSEFRLHATSKTNVLGLRHKVAEWQRICRRHDASLSMLLLYESFYGPLMRRLGRKP